MKRFHLSVVLFLLTGLTACSSGKVMLTPTPAAKYEKLGQATGEACGSLGIGATGYYFIPMALNDRYERAYQQALGTVPGATGLINVTLKEDWYWWVIGTARCVTVSGEAIK